MAHGSGANIAVWATAAERGGGHEIAAVPLADDGAPLAAPQVIAKLAQEATSLVVQRAGGERGGWLIAWSSLLDRGESVTGVALAVDGIPRGATVDIQRTNDHVAWVDLISTPRGGVCLWAEETPSGDANILTAALDPDGKTRGMATSVARGVDRWQAVPAQDGVGLALVEPAARDHAGTTGGGKLRWQRLDPEGQPVGNAVPIGVGRTVSSDVDVVPVPGGWLLGWTDLGGEDAAVQLAMVAFSGHVDGPTAALSDFGSSSLVALASGPRGAAIAWEEPRARFHAERELHVASVATDGALVARQAASIEVTSPAAPELVGTDDGFALLAPAHACRTEEPMPCGGPIVPTVVRFGSTLEPAQAEPLFLGSEHTSASIAWGLRCSGGLCSVLAATSGTPTSVFAVDLPQRTSPFSLPVAPIPPQGVARITGMATVASGPPYGGLAATRVGDRTIVVTLSGAVDGALGRDSGHSPGANILVHAIDDQGHPLSAPATASSRALPTGGIAIAPGHGADGGAALVWVKRDDGDPQVHVALLDRTGRRIKESQLTTAKGDASSVAIAAAQDGWLVSWVDSRDGNGEVYVTKVGRDLTRLGRERRVTNSPGDATDVAIAIRDAVGWLAWSDPRETPREGLGDIYVARVHAEDATRAGIEVRVLSSAPHSRSPQIATTSDGGALVAWIEDAPGGIEGPGAAMIARLDPSGHVISAPARLPLHAPGRPTSIALIEAGDGARVVIARATGDTISLDAVSLGSDGSPVTRPWPLFDLDAAAPFDVVLAIAGESLFFDDVGLQRATHRIRRAAVSWRR
jgi:hypothetical protein